MFEVFSVKVFTERGGAPVVFIAFVERHFVLEQFRNNSKYAALLLSESGKLNAVILELLARFRKFDFIFFRSRYGVVLGVVLLDFLGREYPAESKS